MHSCTEVVNNQLIKTYFCSDHSGSSGSGSVILDDCNFHESVHLDSFDVDRTLTLVSHDAKKLLIH